MADPYLRDAVERIATEACYQISPSNPRAVAEAIPEIARIIREVADNGFRYMERAEELGEASRAVVAACLTGRDLQVMRSKVKDGKVTAKVVPWSSVVGGGVSLSDESGAVVAILAIMNVRMTPPDPPEENAYRERVTQIAHLVAHALNALPRQEALLDECLDYFCEREDADHNGISFVPNEEMRLACEIREVLARLTGAQP